MSSTVPESKALRFGVIGPAGFGGSYLCLELINRGHHVVGISRNPGKLGLHERYTPISADVSTQGIKELALVFENLDVVVNEYGPHSAGADALQYSRSRMMRSEDFRLIDHSAIPRGHPQNHSGYQIGESQVFYHGGRLWKSVHAWKQPRKCFGKQKLVARIQACNS